MAVSIGLLMVFVIYAPILFIAYRQDQLIKQIKEVENALRQFEQTYEVVE